MNEETILRNKERFINLVNSIDREGFNKDLLLSHLENSDFYYAPASTKFHCSFKGGLLQHTLNVYDSIVKLAESFHVYIDANSLKIVSLFHDIAKMNYYETYYRNQKVYSENGTKRDEGGRYDWQQIQDYKVRDVKERFIYYNHEGTSEFIIRQYCPLEVDESIAILHHHGSMSDDCAKDNITAIYNRYPLATLLHLADMASCYIIESDEYSN